MAALSGGGMRGAGAALRGGGRLLLAGIVLALLQTAATGLARADGKEALLVNETARIAANQTKRYVFSQRQPQATLHLHFRSAHAAEGVRLLVTQRSNGAVLADTGYQESATQQVTLPAADDYFVELQNRRQTMGEAAVTLRLELAYEVAAPKPAGPEPQLLSPARRYFTVAASVAIFLMGVAFSAVRLGPALRRRMRA